MMLCLQICQLEKSHTHFEKKNKTKNVCVCETRFFMFFADNNLHGVPSTFEGLLTENILQNSYRSICFARESK